LIIVINKAKESAMSLIGKKSGFQGKIQNISGHETIVERLYEMGFTPGESIHLQSRVLFGEPFIVSIRGTSIALRKDEAQCIEVSDV
jgi:ferrous iron transport protein A